MSMVEVFAFKNASTGKVLEHFTEDRKLIIRAVGDDTSQPRQQWYCIQIDNQFFALKNVATGMVLDHFCGKSIEAYNGDIYHRYHHWKQQAIGERVAIVNRATSKVLEHYGGWSIEAYDNDMSRDDHQWEPIFIRAESSPAPPNEVVALRNVATNKLLEHGKDQRLEAISDDTDNSNRHWYRIPTDGGYFVYMNVATNMRLCQRSGSSVQADNDNTEEHHYHWKETGLGESRAVIANRATGKVLEHDQSVCATAIAVDNAPKHRQWVVVRIHPPVLPPLTHDIVAWKNAASGKVLEHYDCRSVQAFSDDTTNPYHQWYRIPKDCGYFAYMNVATGLVLEHFNGTAQDKPIQAYSSNTDLHRHQWEEQYVGNDLVAISNRTTGKLLKHDDKTLISVVDGDKKLELKSCHWQLVRIRCRTFQSCECTSCVGVDRVEGSVASLGGGVGISSRSPLGFPDVLRLINLRIGEKFLAAIMGGMTTYSCLPPEMVHQIVNGARDACIQQYQAVTEAYDQTYRRFGQVQLEAMLGRLENFVSAWNDSKRVYFTTGGIPGRAVVADLDDGKLTTFVNHDLQDQAWTIENESCVFMDYIDDGKKSDIKEMFRFKTKQLDTIRDASVRTIRGTCDTVCDFTVGYYVTVKEVNTTHVYELRSPASKVSFEYNVGASSNFERASGWETNAELNCEYELAKNAPKLGVKLGGSAESSTGSNRTYQELRSVKFDVPTYICDVDMRVVSETKASVTVTRPQSYCSLFRTGKAVEKKKVEPNFAKEMTTRFTLQIPSDFVKSAWVTTAASDLVNLLMGISVTSILRGDQGLRVVASDADHQLVLKDTLKYESLVDKFETSEFGAAFIIHVCPDEGFYLSVMTRDAKPLVDLIDITDSANNNASNKSQPRDAATESNGGTWVGVDGDGRLVLSKTPAKFRLYRLSVRFKDWVLYVSFVHRFVKRGKDGQFYASETKAPEATSFVFSPVINSTCVKS